MAPDAKSKTIKKSNTLSIAMAAKQQKMGQAAPPARPAADPDPPAMGKSTTFHGAGSGGMAGAGATAKRPIRAAKDSDPTSSTPQKPGGKVAQSTPPKTARPSSTQQSAPSSQRGSGASGGLTKSSSVKVVNPSPALTDASTAPPASPPRPRTATASRMESSKSQPDLVDVGGGYKAKKTGLAPKPALGPKNEFFDAGQQMEAEKWKRWTHQVDKKTLGAHYAYIVRDLPAAVAEPDPNQQEHDVWMSDSLHKKRPEEPAHPRGRDRKPAMTTAFNDRSVRMREGKGAKTALMANDPSPTEWCCHGECTCPVCKPNTMRPAGQPSHHVHYNKVPRCNKDHAPSPPHWEPELSHTFNSGKIGAAVVHPEKGNAPVEEELDFSKNMGRKVKPSTATSPGAGALLPHRSLSEDPRPCAGGFDQEHGNVFPKSRSKSRQRWQGRLGDEPNRSGVALVLSPRTDDPPAPSRISASRRADGHFKAGFSPESYQHAEHYNQENFRFSDPKLPRGRSLPPPSRDPELAGIASGVTGSHLFNCGNPLTMEGKDQYVGAFASARNLSPKGTFRLNPSNDSSRMNSVIDHDECDRAHAALTAYRMQVDTPFAALCGHTADIIETARANADTNKTMRGHATSNDVKSNMCWEE